MEQFRYKNFNWGTSIKINFSLRDDVTTCYLFWSCTWWTLTYLLWHCPVLYTVYKPHFGTRILLFEPFWQLKNLSISEQLLRVVFQLLVDKKSFLLNIFASALKSGIKYPLYILFWPKIGHHSNLNRECKKRVTLYTNCI